MIVSEFMQKPLAVIHSDSSVKEAILLMIQYNENGLSVLKKDRFYGCLTQKQVLKAMYPSQSQFMDAAFHDPFELLEANVEEFSNVKVDDLCDKDMEKYILRPDSDINTALKKMYMYQVSHLPVVVEDQLLGEVHQNDIFNKILGTIDSSQNTADYHDWSSQYHDLVYANSTKFASEIEWLIEELRKSGTNTVLDVGFGSAQHSIALAQAGFHVVGVERSRVPYVSALKKRGNLSREVKERLQFVHAPDLVAFMKKTPQTYDAIIILGNILALYKDDWKDVLKSSQQALKEKGLLITHTANSYAFIHRKKDFIRSTITPSLLAPERLFSITTFFDRKYSKPGEVTIVMSVLRFDGKIWGLEGTNQVVVADLKEKDITSVMEKFPGELNVYGYNSDVRFVKETFDVQKHDIVMCIYKKSKPNEVKTT